MNAAMYRALTITCSWALLKKHSKDNKEMAFGPHCECLWVTQPEHRLYLNISVHRPSNLIELEKFCKKQWKKPKNRCAKLIALSLKTWCCNCCWRCFNKVMSKNFSMTKCGTNDLAVMDEYIIVLSASIWQLVPSHEPAKKKAKDKTL